MTKSFYVVGCGSMGRRRIRHLTLLVPEARILVWDIRPDRMAEVAAMFKVERMNSFDKATLQPSAAMFVCVPPASHEFYMQLAVEHGLDFMVEQPVAHETASLPALRAGIAKQGLVVHISNNHRHSGRIQAIRDVLQAGIIGRPLSAIVGVGEYLPDWHTYEPYTDYYPSKRSMGGGLDAICEIDWLRFLFGDITAGICMAGTYSDLDIDTFDVAQFCFRFGDRLQVVLHTDMLDRQYNGFIHVVGSEGSIRHRMPEEALRIFTSDKGWFTHTITNTTPPLPSMQGKADFGHVEPMYMMDSKAFLDRLDRRDAGLESFDSGVRNVEVVTRLINAAAQQPLAAVEWP